jgi:23S rRNA (adenine2503-C2)-methyltransferase
MSILLKNQTAEGLHALLEPLGVNPRQARQIQSSVFRTGKLPMSLAGLVEKKMKPVHEAVRIPRLTLVEKVVSAQDGFAKYLFRGDGPEVFEAVRIPILHRPEDRKYIVCVSSQAGCALGCAFCFTAHAGFQRNLATWEIVDQVVRIRDDSDLPVRGVVFMGMGEPLLNYDAVIEAARIMSEPSALSICGKSITISTAGIVPGIRRLTAERCSFRLIVSLTAANPQLRRELMPVEKMHSSAELMEALRERHQATGKRTTLAWTMIAGVNTGEEDARQLAELTRGLPIHLDLIDVNDPTGRFRPPSPEELTAFRDALRRHVAAPFGRRYSGGKDIHAACGMLAGKTSGELAGPATRGSSRQGKPGVPGLE